MLTLLWGLPAAAALLVAILGRRAAWLAPALSGAAFVLALASWPQAGSGNLSTSVAWFTGPYGQHIAYSLGLSGLSLLLVALTLLLTALVTLTSLRYGAGFVAWLAMLGAAATGMFLARDLVLFYLFWELMLVPAYFLLVSFGGAGRRAAAWKFLIYNIAGSLALLIAVAALVAFGAAFPGAGGGPIPAAAVGPIALALLIAVAVKTPLFPFHGWVADTYAELPAPAVALVSGVQSKAGLYAMLAILLPLLPGGAAAWAPWVIAAGIVSVLYGALLALTATDARRMLAYSSVSHLGLVAVAFVVANAAALTGGIIQMIAHGLFSAALFLFVGMLESRLNGPVRIRELGGLARRAPAIAGGLTLLGMAALGLPGLAGFPGELLMIVGIYQHSAWIAVLAGVGLILAAAYMLRVVQLVLHGEMQPVTVPDLARPEKWLLAPFAVLLVLFGIFPNPISHQAGSAVAAATAAPAQGGSAR